jgi:MOSC domain-containing protein YiiM
MKGIVVSVNLSRKPDKTKDEKAEGFKIQRFLHDNPTPTDATMQSLLDATQQVKKQNISKQPQDHIQLDVGGVVGDTHFTPIIEIKEGREKFLQRRIAEVNFFNITEYKRLNQLFGTNVAIGSLGENITTDGINLDALPCNTILEVGTAKVKILERRSFCYRFINVFMPDKNFWSLSDRQKFDRTKVGIVGQVIEPGIVRPGDTITAILPEQFFVQMPLPGIPTKYVRTKVVDDQPPSMLE